MIRRGSRSWAGVTIRVPARGRAPREQEESRVQGQVEESSLMGLPQNVVPAGIKSTSQQKNFDESQKKPSIKFYPMI